MSPDTPEPPSPVDFALSSSKESHPMPRSLRELVDMVSGRNQPSLPVEEAGPAEALPFPFLALVGQQEMKLALLLSVINPAIGGVLLIGPRGTGKTTAVRSLLRLLPDVQRSTCFYGCLPEDVETGGMDAVCPECARKYGQGEPLVISSPVSLVELPLNSRLSDVIGRLDEGEVAHERMRLKRGLLAQADLNLLFVDEVNLLADEITNAILDAAAAGSYTIRQGAHSAVYRARLTLIGSMNPEEGNLRPQIMDRFGLRVVVRGLQEPDERLEAYQRSVEYFRNPRAFVNRFELATRQACQEISVARSILPQVALPEEMAKLGIQLIQKLGLDSIRAEITLFESARAMAAADNRTQVTITDIRLVAPLALRLRRSEFMEHYFSERSEEDARINQTIQEILPD